MKVSEVNFLIKKNLESIEELTNLTIEGEVENAKEYPSAVYSRIVETEDGNIKSTINSICWKKEIF